MAGLLLSNIHKGTEKKHSKSVAEVVFPLIEQFKANLRF